MRRLTFFVFLLLTSGILFTPLVQPPQEVQLNPDTPKSLVVVMRTTQLQISTDIDTGVEYNISLIQDNGELRTIQVGLSILDEDIIPTPEPGSYEITFLADDFGTIEIRQVGITTAQTIYFTLLFVSFLYVITRETGIIG